MFVGAASVVGAEFDAIKHESVQSGNVIEIMIERQQTCTLVDGACGDPDVIDWNRCPCSFQGGVDAAVMPRDGVIDGDDSDEGLRQKLAERHAVLPCAGTQFEPAVKLTQHRSRHHNCLGLGNQVTNAGVARAKPGVSRRIEH